MPSVSTPIIVWIPSSSFPTTIPRIHFSERLLEICVFDLCRLLIQNYQKWQVAVAAAEAMVEVKVDVGDTAVSKEGKIMDPGHIKDLAQLVAVNQMDTTTEVDVSSNIRLSENV